MNKLGLYFRREKLEALLRGDVSNTVVSRYFVYRLQATGMYFCEVPEATPAMVRLQARYSQLAWETLVEIYGTGDHKLKAQGLMLFVHGLIILGFSAGAQLYLSKMCEIIDTAKLQLLPVYGRPAELSEQVREDTAVLSQAIYLDNYLYLTSSGSTSVMTTRIEKEFRLDLEVSTNRWFFVAGLKIDSAARYRECTHTCSTYVHWPCGPKVFCWSETRSQFWTPTSMIVRLT